VLLRDQLLQVPYLMLQLCGLSLTHLELLQLYGLSLTHLELLVSLVQLGLEVVDVALGGGHLILRVLQLGAGVVKEVSLEVTAAISSHQLIIQFLDMRLQAGILL
jgi:hypothetical protein